MGWSAGLSAPAGRPRRGGEAARDRRAGLDPVRHYAGIALLSYVLEIFGEHVPSLGEVLGLLALALALLFGYGLHARRTAFLVAAGAGAVPHLDLRGRSGRQLRLPGSASAACRSSCRCSTRSGSARCSPVQPGLLDHAAGDRGDEHQGVPAGEARPLSATAGCWSPTPSHDGRPADGVRRHHARHAALAGSSCRRSATARWTSTQYTSMNTLVYADVPEASARPIASTFQQLLDQLRGRRRRADRGALRAGETVAWPARRDDHRPAPGLPGGVGRVHHRLDVGVRPPEGGRRLRQPRPARRTSIWGDPARPSPAPRGVPPAPASPPPRGPASSRAAERRCMAASKALRSRA